MRIPNTTTLEVKNTSRTIWVIAPALGIHLPMRSGMIAPIVEATTNTVPKTNIPPRLRTWKNLSNTAMATTVTDPPSHIGVPAQ